MFSRNFWNSNRTILFLAMAQIFNMFSTSCFFRFTIIFIHIKYIKRNMLNLSQILYIANHFVLFSDIQLQSNLAITRVEGGRILRQKTALYL